MKIFRLSGGLGNQFFSYAACYQYCKDHNEPIVMDTSTQEAPWFFRDFDLAHFNIRIDKKICYRLGDSFVDHALLNHVCRRAAIGLFTPTVYEDKRHYYPDILEPLPKHCYLIGDWQRLGYIDKYEEDLRKLFTYKEKLSNEAEVFAGRIKNDDKSVAIHARRGDIAEMGGALGAEYFYKAIGEIERSVENPSFYCFSEDTAWLRTVMEPLRDRYPFTYMDYESSLKGLEDFELMRSCRHQIIANSTYSWWAAWLNSNPDKVVIYPYSGRENYWPKEWIPC